MGLDVISFSKAVQALRKAGFIGTKSVDETNLKDGNIVEYSTELDKYISTELKTKVYQWKQNHEYEKNQMVVFDNMLYWVLEQHSSHVNNIDYDVLANKIMPFATSLGLPNVMALDYELQSNGTRMLLTWENPVTYDGVEVYVSDSVDITAMTRNAISNLVSGGTVQLVHEGLGTGAELLDSVLVNVQTRKNYFVKVIAKHLMETETQYSSGRFLTISNPDIYSPQSPTNLQITIKDGNNLRLAWTQPNDTDFLRTRVVRSVTGFPTNPTDGTVLGSVEGIGLVEFVDVLIEKGVIYYYSLFAFDDAGNGFEHGVEGNWSIPLTGTGVIYEMMGFDFNTLQRIGRAESLEQSDFNTVYPWSDIKRAVVDNGGNIVYYLDENNSNFKEDGTTPAILDGTDGNVIVEYPFFYFKWDNGKAHIADKEFAGATLIPRTLVGAFEGYKNEILGEMRSIAGVKPTTGQSISEYRLLASGIGTGWQNTDINFLNILKVLFVIEYGALNSQQLVGSGIVTGTTERNTGGTLALGNNSGVGFNGSVSYRGLENPWGNTWEFIEGLVATDASYYIATSGFGNFVSDSNTGSYISNGVVPTVQDGYISTFIGDGNFLASEVIGNSMLPVGDYQYSHKLGETNLAVHGGNYEDGERAGIFRVHMGVKKFAVEKEMTLIETVMSGDVIVGRIYEKEITENELEKIKNVEIA